ncbi:FAD-dependent oxidoreductase [Streptomyces sp. NPDC001812]|uniref:FAD-dependent oxidoreductase n=1 Tax=Streptomyces sp. NPDC001812 TaxID=3364611 RepID=UPI0036BC0BE7
MTSAASRRSDSFAAEMVTMARDSGFHAPRAGSSAPTSAETPSWDGAPAAGSYDPAAVDWEGLRGRLEGTLLRPDDVGFDDARKGFNPLHDDHVPAAVAQCASAADVAEAVVAAGGRVPLAARSGGHSYVGYSAPPDGLVVDLRRMSQVDATGDGSVTVGAGAPLRSVYSAVGQANRCLPAGSCFTVGIAGVTLGGGIGVLQRKFGLTCDHLTAAEAVTAGGRVLTATAAATPDLFWALRGGGGGNLSIVTSFTFATDPAPALTVFVLTFPEGKVTEILTAWQPWIAGAPREMWANFKISGGNPPSCRVAGCFVGPSTACYPLLDDLILRAGVVPTGRNIQDRDYFNGMRFFSGKPLRESFVASSRILTTPTPDPQALTRLLTGRTGTSLIFDPLGGAVADTVTAQTAFPHRDAFATAQIYASATMASEPDVTRNVAEIVAGLGALGIGGGYVNYIDPNLPDWPTAYYGPNLHRLRSIAHDYDPDHLFDFPQSLHHA